MLQNYVACLRFPVSAGSEVKTRLLDVRWPSSCTYDEGVLEERGDAMRFVAPIWVRQAGQSHFDKVKEMSRMKSSILTRGRPDGQFNSGYVAERFSALEDPRTGRTKRHNLIDVVVIAICAVICGADSWVDVEVFGKSKKAWLSRILGLPNGIPSYYTFGRVSARLDSVQFE